MRPAAMLGALASALFTGLAVIPVQRCLAEQLALQSVKESFKAVILTPRAYPANTATAEAVAAAGVRPWLAASDKDQLAAEALADDLVETLSALLARERARSRAVADGLVNSLSELLAREKNAAAAAAAGGVAAGPRAAEWSSFLDGLTGAGGPLEVLGASDSGQETPIAAAAAAAEGPEDALLSEPCDSRFWKLTAAGKEEKDAGQERVVSESRMLRGELASLGGRGETTGAAAAAAVRGGKGRRTLVGGATAAAVGEGQNFAECPEVVETVGEEDFLKIESTWLNVVLTGVCVVCAGLAAGLTMGLLSIEPLEMAIKQRSGTSEEQLQASRILPLVSRHHFLLVTLLLFNSLANEALPIFLGNLVPSWLAVILSVSLVLFFGEIFPSAVFTGKNQLAIAAGMSWFVYTLMMVLGPVAWPISWMLDRVLGIEGFKRYNRAEISALVEVQQELSCEDVTNLPLHADEVSIVNGVLLTAERSVSEAMITMDKVFCLGMHEKLSGNTMADIMAAGYSRVLVYEGEDTRNIRGYLQVKKLIVLNPDDERTISSLMLRVPVVVSPTKSLLELLNTFQTGKSHLALVSASPAITLESLKRGVRLEGAARPMGIITLEDIIEEIIQEEIMDESDRLTQFIEDRAKDTLLRFARKRQERQSNGQINSLMASIGPLGTPRRTEETTLLKHLGTTASGTPSRGGSVTPPSPSYQSMAGGSSYGGGRGGGGGADSPLLSSLLSSSPPAAPGIEERASLLTGSTRSGSQRRLSTVKNVKRGSATVGQAMLAAASRAREHSSGSDNPAAAAAAAPGRGGAFSLFRQGSAGSSASVNDSTAYDAAAPSSGAEPRNGGGS